MPIGWRPAAGGVRCRDVRGEELPDRVIHVRGDHDLFRGHWYVFERRFDYDDVVGRRLSLAEPAKAAAPPLRIRAIERQGYRR